MGNHCFSGLDGEPGVGAPGVPAHGSLKQNCCEFGTNLGYRVDISQRKQNCCEFEANLAYRGKYLKTKGKRRERREARREEELER